MKRKVTPETAAKHLVHLARNFNNQTELMQQGKLMNASKGYMRPEPEKVRDEIDNYLLSLPEETYEKTLALIDEMSSEADKNLKENGNNFNTHAGVAKKACNIIGYSRNRVQKMRNAAQK